MKLKRVVNNCMFDEIKHLYYNKKTNSYLISVTQLLRKHGVAPSYDNVSESVLTAKAERGTLIHDEISRYFKHRKLGFTSELYNVIDYFKANDYRVVASEKTLYNDIVGGRLDVVYEKDNKLTLSDFKTTSSLHKESVSWQLSIYAYLFEKMYDVTIDKITVIWLKNETDLQEIELMRKSNEEVEKLLECEKSGTRYQFDVEKYQDDLQALMALQTTLEQYKLMSKELETKAKNLQEKLLQAMEENAVTKLQFERMTISYVAPSETTKVDSDKLKDMFPDIYDQCLTTQKRKAYVKITIKKDK